MSEETEPIAADNSAIAKRLWRFTSGVLAAETVLSLIKADWKFTLGVIVGGLLALLNFRLLKSSASGAIESQTNSFVLRFFARYAIVGSVILFFYLTEIVSIIGILLGLCAFVGALLLEAGFQLYFAIFKNEEV